MKEFAEKQIQRRLQKHLTKKELKEFSKELADILSSLDSSWWEVCIELIPAIGDLYGTGRLAQKIRRAYDKLQNLENKMVGKVSRRLKRSKAKRDKFMKSMRGNGVRDARRDVKEMNKQLGTKARYKGRQGHHMDSVSLNPERASDPRNIEFLSKKEHLKRHGGDWRSPTSSGGRDIHRN